MINVLVFVDAAENGPSEDMKPPVDLKSSMQSFVQLRANFFAEAAEGAAQRSRTVVLDIAPRVIWFIMRRFFGREQARVGR